jgi:hypothetical protein
MTKPRCFGVFLLSMALPLLAQEAEPSTGTAGQSPSPATAPSVQLIPRSPEARESASRAARHIILNVVVTDTSGKPVPGREPGVAQASANDKRNYFDAIVDLSTGFRVAQMTLDAVSSPELWHETGLRRDYYKILLNGVQTANQADSGNLALQVLAYESGG